MDISKIPTGRNPPWDVNAIIEIPLGGEPVKYEIDKESGALFVDRFLHTAMTYPANYGFIPHTLSQDGDPCDIRGQCDPDLSSEYVIPKGIRPVEEGIQHRIGAADRHAGCACLAHQFSSCPPGRNLSNTFLSGNFCGCEPVMLNVFTACIPDRPIALPCALTVRPFPC